MVDVERLEELGRAIMSASVEAEYLEQRRVVDSLDAAFASVVAVIADQRGRVAGVERVENVEGAEGRGYGG